MSIKQRYLIKDKDGMVLSDFHTNAPPPKNAVPVSDDLEIPRDLYAGDQPRIKLTDKVTEIYPSQPSMDHVWDGERKAWKMLSTETPEEQIRRIVREEMDVLNA